MSQGFIGEQLGSFRVEEVLGSGAMGIVFKATHETTGRKAAVKIVQGEVAENTKLLQRFSREAEIIKQFRHPNIVRWLATGKYKGTYYFAMEYVEGATLDKVLQDRGEVPWREVVDLGIQICDALHYAHQQGVVHRDLKPSNLMVTPDGRVKLTDFGIAKDLDKTALTQPGRTLGTAAYMAPEQIRGTPAVSHKTDLYALGALLYQILVGKAPFSGATAMVLMHCHINEAPPRPSAKVREIPKALDDLVVALMAKEPAQRPWDAEAVAVVLRELRDKAEKSQPVAMVWPAEDSPANNPTRAAIGVPAKKVAAPKGKKKKAKTVGTMSTLAPDDDDTSLFTRERLEVGGLVLGLVVIGGFITYWLWPPSAEYLYRHAVPLMESSRRSDWIAARDEYFGPLDEKHPDHPYKEQTRAWRDKIALDEAESRSKLLASPTPTPFSEPQNNGERQFAVFNTLAAKSAAEGDELKAEGYWRQMVAALNPDDPEERRWHLLAVKRAEALATRIRERRAFVEEQVRRAFAAMQAGDSKQAMAIQGMLREKYSRFTDLEDIFAAPPEADSDAPESSKTPSPAEPEKAAPAKPE